jgi:hypothetical protein
MAEAIYALCALASLVCALLLVRGYLRSRLRLILLACLCFGGLALNNVLLFVDLVLVPQLDLSVLRSLVAVASLLVLVVGLVWEET